MAREYPLDKIRNIGIMAHIDAGKTTCTERILYYTNKLYKIGETHEGTATMDWMEQERERGITIMSAATTTQWKDCCINVIDTPGHVDFTVEVERSLRVLDGAVALFCAKGGVEPQSETVWHQATKYKVPRIAFVNKMDINGADFYNVMDMMRSRLHANPVAILLPIGKESEFQGIIDIIGQKAVLYTAGAMDKTEEFVEIPEKYKDEALLQRAHLAEVLADYDDVIMEKVLMEEEVSDDELKVALRKATISMQVTPVLCGSAYKNKGVQRLLDAIVDYLPSPVDIDAVVGTNEKGDQVTRNPSDDEPLAGLAFKIVVDQYGKMAYYRIYSGVAKTGMTVYNATKGKKERIGRIVRLHSNSRTEIEEAYAGDIVGLIGLKETTTGDTLCAIHSPIILESMDFPEPVVRVAIEPKTKTSQERMGIALSKLAEEDPTFKTYTDRETGQTIIAGMGELHLDIIVDRLLREFKVEANIGQPQVAYREAIKGEAAGEGKYIRQSGGRGQYGHCKIIISPNEEAKGFEFKDETVGGVIPKEYIRPIADGIREAAMGGVLLGYEMVDFKVRLVDGSFHEVDSSEMAFKIAGSMAFRDAALKAQPTILEPLMDVEVSAPEEYLGTILSTISSRRGMIRSIDDRLGLKIVRADVPLSEMFGYTTDLRSVTQGRGNSMMQLKCFAEVPASEREKLLKKGG